MPLLTRLNFWRNSLRSCRVHSACTPPPPPPIKEAIVTLLDASNFIGQNLALVLKQNPQICELRLFDEVDDVRCIADDLNYIDTRTVVVPFSSTSLKEAVTGAHVVISAGGYQERCGQSQTELFEANGDNVRIAAMHLAEFNPSAVYCIAKPPVEALVPMASEEYKKSDSYDFRKIIGVTTHASMVANTYIAQHLGKDPTEVLCPIIGGMGPKTTVAVISQTKPTVTYDSKIYADLQDLIATSDEAFLKSCKEKKSSGLSRVIAVSRFVGSVIRALTGDKSCVECAYVRQTGHIDEFLPYMTSIVRLGLEGIESTHMPKTNAFEAQNLRAAVPHILENILLGQSFVIGDYSSYQNFKRKRRACDCVLKRKIDECNNARAVINN